MIEMRKKYLWVNIIIGILLFLWACSPTATLNRKYLGKKFDPHLFNELEDSGHHLHKTEVFNVEYDYVINRNKKIITLDGTLEYTERIAESMFRPQKVSLNVTRCDLGVLFADETGTIVHTQVFHVPPEEIYDHTTQFTETLPYSDDYKLIVMGAYIVTEE